MLSFLRIHAAVAVATLATRLSEYSAGAFFQEFLNSPFAYWALGLSVIVTEELSPILAGMAANEGELELVRAIVAITLGGWVMTSLLYLVGRLKWESIRRRWPKVRATGTVALRVVARNPITASLFVRFAFGLRVVLPLACGAARVPVAIYLPATLIGSALWSALFTLIGYAAGEAAVRVMGKLGRTGELIGALIVCLLLLAFLRWNRRRTERKAAKRHAAAKRALADASSAVES